MFGNDVVFLDDSTIVQCECGWKGKQTELIKTFVSETKHCPKCEQIFVDPFAHKSMPKLVPSRPDADVAKDLKTELEAKLGEVCIIIDKANAAGFEVAFNLGKRWDGKQVIGQLTIAKHF